MRVRLPDGREINVQTNDPQEAAAAGRRIIATEQAAKGIATSHSNPGLESLANGFTFGLTRQAGAVGNMAGQGINNLIDRAQGKTPDVGVGDAYNGYLQAASDAARKFQSQHPVASTGLGVLGGLAAPGATQIGKFVTEGVGSGLAAARGVVPSMARGALAGAGIGATSSAANAEPGQQLQQAAQGAKLGAALGTAAPVVEAGVRAAAPAVGSVAQFVARTTGNKGDPMRVAAQKLSAALSAEGLTPADARAAMNDWLVHGNDAPTILDIAKRGGPVQSLIRGAAASGGNAGAAATDYARSVANQIPDRAQALTSRLSTDPRQATQVQAQVGQQLDQAAQGAPQRLTQDFTDTLGVHPADARGAADAAVVAGRQAASPLYTAALDQPGPVWNEDLAQLAQRPSIRKAMGAAHASLLDAGRDPTTVGLHMDPDTGLVGTADPNKLNSISDATMQQPTAEAWNLVKKKLGALVSRDPITGKVIASGPGGAENANLSTAGTDLTAALRKAIPGYSDALDTAGDYLSNQNAYKRATGVLLHPGTDATDVTNMLGSMSPPEADSARAAMANDIHQLAQNGRLRPAALAAPAIQQKLSAAFGPQGASQFMQRVGQEADLGAGNVPTGALTPERAQMGQNLTTLGDLVHGDTVMNAVPPVYGQRPVTADTQLGARDSIIDQIGRPRAGATGLLNRIAAPGASPNVTQNLATTFGDAAPVYQQAIGNEVSRLGSARYIDPTAGSKTAGALQDIGLVDMPSLPDHIPTTPHGIVGKLVAGAVKKLNAGNALSDGEKAALVGMSSGDTSGLLQHLDDLAKAQAQPPTGLAALPGAIAANSVPALAYRPDAQ